MDEKVSDPWDNLRRFTQAVRGIHDIAEQLRAMKGQSLDDLITRASALAILRAEMSKSVALPANERKSVQDALRSAIRAMWDANPSPPNPRPIGT